MLGAGLPSLPVAQVSHHLVLVLPQVSGQMPPHLDDYGQAQLVPAAKGVDRKGGKVIASASHLSSYFCSLALCACSTAFPPLLWGSCHQSLLEGVDHGDVVGGIFSKILFQFNY